MIKPFGITKTETGFYGAKTRIGRAENKPGNACIYQCSGTHYAGFDGTIKRKACKTIIANPSGRFAQNNYFSVGSRI